MKGTRVSHYTLFEKLGEGDIGVVYKAQDMKLNRFLALKFRPHHVTANETDRTRFLKEAQSAAVLNHPDICTVHAIEDVEGQ